MHTLLKNHSEDISQKLSATEFNTGRDSISPNLRRKLLFRHFCHFDWQEGGLPGPIKFLDRDSIEYALCQAAQHDRNEERMARLCLEKGMALIDENDGGIYQFASGKDWQQCRYSKSIAAQAGSLRLYALAYALFKEHCYLLNARKIYSYIQSELLSDDGLFKSPQIPGVIYRPGKPATNQHGEQLISTRDNGWLIESLASYYEFCGDDSALKLARQTMNTLLDKKPGCTGHPSQEDGQPKPLADLLALARACLQLYRTAADPFHLKKARLLAMEIAGHHRHREAGYACHAGSSANKPGKRQIDENICLGRFFNLLHHYSGDNQLLELARHAMRYLSAPQVALARPEEAGILLFDEELASTPLKITIMANRNDGKTHELLAQSLRAYGWYKVIHWQVNN